MSGHTPGPWVIDSPWIERCGGGIAIVNREHPGHDWDVAIVHSTEANARLIAAAPDLLAAGAALVERWDTPLWKDAPHTAEFIHALRDAIAKATGAAK